MRAQGIERAAVAALVVLEAAIADIDAQHQLAVEAAAAVVLRAGIQRRGIVVESAVHQLQRDLVRKFEIVLLIDGAAARIDIRGAAVGELDVLQSHGEGGRVLRRVGVDDAHDAAHAAAG